MQAEVKQVIKDYSIWYVLAHAQAEIILRQKVHAEVKCLRR